MKLRRSIIYSLIMIILIVITFSATLSYGVDNLVLYGIVKNINPAKGKITIDVKTKACYGIRDFYLRGRDNEKKIKIKNLKRMIGKKIVFAIESSSCKHLHRPHIIILPLKGE